jgi:hypothetical protein
VETASQGEESAHEPLPARDTERRVGHYVWLERRRFEVLGQAAASVPEPEVKVLLATHARHHAWHASLWEAHLPRRSGPGTTGLVAPGHAGLAAGLDALSGDDAGAIALLAGAYRVVAPRAVVAYEGHLARASVVSDAALVRTCRLVLADQLDDRRRGEELLQSLLTNDAAVERAAAHCGRLEKLLGGVAEPHLE